ncbi:MAG TPA: zinc ribbon domain-containing protein [Nitrospira sp.]|nr:zinc ribbon domain-containing protein [Nitrospira sp.]
MALGLIATRLCPKCGFEQPEEDDTCRKCGIIFSKYRPAVSSHRSAPPTGEPSSPWWTAAKQVLFETDRPNDSVTLLGRACVFVLLAAWGGKFIVTPLETNYTGESFLHLINLPFHEAGHLLFMPFGRFMMFLGGSLGQVLMPIVCLVTFLIRTRDPFGASVALWWTAENFMDLAPYINDARSLDLMLLGGVTGKETDAHDWENILGMLGWLQYDHRLAHLSYNVGTVLMLASLCWSGLLLVRHYSRMS